MRPRKLILLVEANEVERDVHRFLLETRGYRVLAAHDAASALALHDLKVDLVLGMADGMLREWDALAATMKARLPEIPVIVVTRLKSVAPRTTLAPAADWVYRSETNVELLEWVRWAAQRRRGPCATCVEQPIKLWGQRRFEKLQASPANRLKI